MTRDVDEYPQVLDGDVWHRRPADDTGDGETDTWRVAAPDDRRTGKSHLTQPGEGEKAQCRTTSTASMSVRTV